MAEAAGSHGAEFEVQALHGREDWSLTSLLHGTNSVQGHYIIKGENQERKAKLAPLSESTVSVTSCQ